MAALRADLAAAQATSAEAAQYKDSKDSSIGSCKKGSQCSAERPFSSGRTTFAVCAQYKYVSHGFSTEIIGCDSDHNPLEGARSSSHATPSS